MINGQKPNKPLFSQHYLKHRLQESPEWQVDVEAEFQKLKQLYVSKKSLLPKLSEAQTEDVFIKPALDLLGFSNIPQVVTRGKGRAERPDYALFNSESDRDAAYPLQSDETAFYGRVSAIAEAKYWERPLSKVSANDKRDIYKNENPSFQITNYLTGTGVDWGILTNGREWRLYYRQASSTATEFYQVDLVELLEAEDLEKFKYFWLFFRQEAFVKDSQGRNFLERVREGSTTYATRVGNELKALVFDRIFPDLAGGFVADATRRGKQVTSEQVYEATLSFLYKLLFLLYAEARNLLPIEGDYRNYSLIKLTQEVAQGIDSHRNLSQTSTGMYDRLLGLFQIIDRGDPGLGVPRYNGGLFHFDFHQQLDRIEYHANHFLSQFKIADAVLAPVLDRLARFEGQLIDYSFLGVRQLGSIYEGLLEYRVVIEDAATGKVHLENDKGDRKATGSYYTPDYIVKYIVSHTIKPILAQRKAKFSELMAQITQLQNQLQDKRLGKQSINGLQKDLQRLEREAQSTLLDIKVCDPAMGSGHFLVEAVDYLTDELIGILTEYPEHNPVLEMLDQTRQSILENLKQQRITINPDRLEPTQLLQRVVMKRCIYGVDLNPMAVELAKVSLWLHSFTIGAPLSFLDHHLRCGNSLIGTTAREAEAKMAQEESGQLNFLTGPFVGLLKAAEIMRGVSVLSDATFAEVEQSEKLFRSFDEAAKPFKRLLDIYVSKFFGLKQADNFLRVYGTSAITANPNKMNKADKAVYEEAQKLSEEKRFFHWDLEFPEVFIDLENASWNENAGFDVVVGNPPYVRQEGLGEIKPFFKAQYKSYHGVADLYTYFYERGVTILRTSGALSYIVTNKWLRAGYGEALRQFFTENCVFEQIVDFGHAPIFADADVFPCIVVVRKAYRSNATNSAQSPVLICPVPREKLEGIDLTEYVHQSGYPVPWARFTADAWSLEHQDVDDLMTKIQTRGVSLSDFVGEKPLYGLKTGFNEAFLINEIHKTKIVQSDHNSDRIIKPYLRGQDVKRWFAKYDNLWMILTSTDIDIDNYPGVKKHLEQYRTQLEKRAGNQLWWQLQARPAYISVFEQPKIIYQEIQFHSAFSYDESGLYSNNKAFILPTSDLYLIGVLNSPLLWWYSWRYLPHMKDEALSPSGYLMESLPIASPSDEIRSQVEPKVSRLIELTKINQENQSDVMDWLRSVFHIEKLGQKLEDFSNLSQQEFIDEISKRLPKAKKGSKLLGVYEQKQIKEAYNEFAVPMQTRNREILQLEHQLSDLVNQAYELTPEDIDLMWKTAPPRMPIQKNSNEDYQ
ncbi:Eco57I restriction-modification methylase domain-containing protein [Limnoraphis robusta]|uniref:site-specific DNA-methyltransferase (adenine-specific) n=1 Tax=Limnoraphis robusta CCNP1315 TaxID=3110306 RepID=A0ABU5TTG0_9CYAN|nr:Eco57I restriction-modification methylase domain-containing protein [Limnoraphis robusta]MEA5518089.1 Eco57I restriction-modification methylase domain-containing protein [Limnoraphis robusta CCNP1315]MEA5547285.1 Eco57I restriction-modification methylase domain-containing protein [Limnoraphis robusta CCNP1324]